MPKDNIIEECVNLIKNSTYMRQQIKNKRLNDKDDEDDDDDQEDEKDDD